MGRRRRRILVAAVLGSTYEVHKTKGNLNNHIGLPLTLLMLEETTQFAVVEMGMSGRGEIALLSEISRARSGHYHDDWRVAYAAVGVDARKSRGRKRKL